MMKRKYDESHDRPLGRSLYMEKLIRAYKWGSWGYFTLGNYGIITRWDLCLLMQGYPRYI